MSDSPPTLGSRLREFRCFDFSLFIDPSDAILGPIVTAGVYEHHIMPVFRDTIFPGASVLDIGANVGVYSVAAALMGARVTAIDASSENCKLIALNARHNNVDVNVLPCAVSDTFGMSLFARSEQSNKTIRQYQLTRETFDQLDAAPAVPIDSIIGNEKIDVVKIDIEGREYAALKPANRLFEWRPKFFVEYSGDFVLHGSGVPGPELLKLFTDRGYTATFINLRGPNQLLGTDVDAINQTWQREKGDGITIIDLLFTPPKV